MAQRPEQPPPPAGDISSNSVIDGTHGDLYFTSPTNFSSSGIVLQPKPTWPDVSVALVDPTSTSEFTVFNGSGADKLSLFTVRGDGVTTIGQPPSPYARLHSHETKDGGIALYGSLITNVEAAVTQTDRAVVAAAQQFITAGVENTGFVYGVRSSAYAGGEGTAGATFGVMVDSGVLLGATNTPTVKSAYGIRINIEKRGGTVQKGYGLFLEDVEADTGYGIYQEGVGDINYFAGSMGIGTGTTTPSAKLHVAGTARITSTLTADAGATVAGAATIGGGATIAGNVGIGTTAPAAKLHVVGNATVTGQITGDGNAHFAGTVTGGNIRAKYQDVAEWVPSTTDLAPGTVVVLNPDRNNEVMASSQSYDLTVAGVVSAQPGLSLGEEGEGKEQIATTGRVRVRVDATAAPIKVGDLLVTSAVSGTAMKSQPMSINGRNMHQPGTILGKALEPLQQGMGEILVLLSMQ